MPNYSNKNFWKSLIKFRTSIYRLLIETVRLYEIPLNDRSCTLCNIGKLADELCLSSNPSQLHINDFYPPSIKLSQTKYNKI